MVDKVGAAKCKRSDERELLFFRSQLRRAPIKGPRSWWRRDADPHLGVLKGPIRLEASLRGPRGQLLVDTIWRLTAEGDIDGPNDFFSTRNSF